MNILISGSSGFVGLRLIDFLVNKGHQLTAVDAMPLPNVFENNSVRFIQADTTETGPWQEALHNVEVVINLTGKNIFHLWSKKYKQQIYDSRIITTRNIVNRLPEGKSVTLINTSAAGYYGSCGDEVLDENKVAGSDFLARVCVDWEKEAFLACKKGIRVACARFGVVLGKSGGALSKMIPAYRMSVGGPLGDGKHWFPWIHIDDLVDAIDFVIHNNDIEGPINFTSPNPVQNNGFSKALASVLKRPSFFRTPAFMLRLAAGELGDLLLNSQRAVPTKLLSSGFSFRYPDLTEALKAAIG